MRRFIVSNSIVIREGKKKLISNKYLVPGDIIALQEGQRIPADARIITSNSLQVDEAVLTGESLPVRKHSDIVDEAAVIGNQHNMLFNGTYVLSGSGIAVVTATGEKTEIGKIHATVEEIKTDMPLKQELNRLSYWILLFILGICMFLFVVGFLQGKPLQELLIMLTALFICVVPEGLPVVLTLILVSGVYRMAKHNVLIKNMQAVEGLGRTDVIVIDKTGTLTRNEMVIARVFVDNQFFTAGGQGYHAQGDIYDEKKQIVVKEVQPESLRTMGIACSLLNSTEITYLSDANLFDIKGDPTEAALYVFSQKLGFSREQLEGQYHKIYEIPFDPAYRYHAGFYEKNGEGVMFLAGSPEVIMARALNTDQQAEKALSGLLMQGLRVVAVAMHSFDPTAIEVDQANSGLAFTFFKQLAEGALHFLGLCAIEDAIRPEVAVVVEQARNAGIRVIMATGDHQKTALYVAKRVGIFRDGDQAIDGPEFEQATNGQLLVNLRKITVFSRVSPTHKLRIIKLFHQQRKIIAMTGDGINDAPSLVAADLGIAMGRIGTEVAKQASDIILLDDSFANIISAIEQGRHIFYTLKRVVLYFFATNMGEILIVLFALILNMKLPITAAQILWLNLVTDGFLDIALSTEPKESGLLQQEWLGKKLRLVDRNLLLKMVWMAIPMGLVSLCVFWYYQQFDIVHARTMTLITMAMFQWFNAWNCRSATKSVFQLGLLTNRWLVVTTVFVFSLQIAVLHVPFLQRIFKTVPISLTQWLLIIALSSLLFVVEEIRKWFVRWCYD